MHKISTKCRACDFSLDHEIADGLGFATRGLMNDYTALLGDAYDDVLNFCKELWTHASETSHTPMFLTHRIRDINAQSRIEIQMSSFIEKMGWLTFSTNLAEIITHHIRNAERLRVELQIIEEFVQTDADAESLQQLREQNCSNRDIIAHFLNLRALSCAGHEISLVSTGSPPDAELRLPRGDGKSQIRLDYDESTLKSTGKSVSIDEVLEAIDEALEARNDGI